ncbi:MAG: alanine racemase [Paracoccaceae bacterium]
MYLDHVLEKSPALCQAALEMHQKGLIPANSWVVDLDAIADNAAALAHAARAQGLTTYLMSKQHNRNPYINAIALGQGLHKIVAVDATCCLHAARYGLPLGHAGHLNQIPQHQMAKVVAMRPEVITIYNVEHASWIDRTAAKLGIIQDLLIRVHAPEDVFFTGQEGGFAEGEIPALVTALKAMPNVRLIGVTAFPCLRYNETAAERVEITPNMHTIIRAAEQLRALGVEVHQINAPGNTSCADMALLKSCGATHVEPGNALLGTVPNNAFRNDLAERTAFVYISEISHFYEGRAYAYGGGVYHTAYGDKVEGLVGANWQDARNNRVEYRHDVPQDIDYHMQFLPTRGQRCEIGDSVLCAYRTQMHMTRSYVVPISGLTAGQPQLHYIFDNANNALDKDFNPVASELVRRDIDALIMD